MPLKNPYIRYTVRQETAGAIYPVGGVHTIDDKPEVLKYYKWISYKEVLKIRKKAYQAKKSAQRAQEAAAYREREKAEKQAFKDMLKKNPEWISTFAGKLGLQKSVVEAMYGVCGKDEILPVMCGIYCDDEGYIVATDAHCLVSLKCKVPKAYEGKIFAPSGKAIDGKYPNWRGVMPTTYVKTGTFKDVDIKPKEVEVGDYDKKKIKVVDFNHARLSYEKLTKIKKVFAALKEQPDVLQMSKKDVEERVKRGFCGIDRLSVQYISKTAKAIQMPIVQ